MRYVVINGGLFGGIAERFWFGACLVQENPRNRGVFYRAAHLRALAPCPLRRPIRISKPNAFFATLHGREEHVRLRGQDASNPVVLLGWRKAEYCQPRPRGADFKTPSSNHVVDQ
jgi:hypothetical protein